MKLFLFIPISFMVLLCACGHSGNTPEKEKTIVPADTARFYPLSDFFRQQIEYVDLRNFRIYKLTTIDGKKDSTVIDKDAFIRWAGLFRQRSFAEPGARARYRETVFEDLSTDSYTINYTPYTPALVAVKTIDILLTQETNTVKRVFIRSQYAKGDTTVEEQCSWKTDKSFQVNRTRYTKNGFRSTELNYINWNDF